MEPNAVEPPREAVDLSDLLKVLASRIEDFRDLLVVPRSVVWTHPGIKLNPWLDREKMMSDAYL